MAGIRQESRDPRLSAVVRFHSAYSTRIVRGDQPPLGACRRPRAGWTAFPHNAVPKRTPQEATGWTQLSGRGNGNWRLRGERGCVQTTMGRWLTGNPGLGETDDLLSSIPGV